MCVAFLSITSFHAPHLILPVGYVGIFPPKIASISECHCANIYTEVQMWMLEASTGDYLPVVNPFCYKFIS